MEAKVENGKWLKESAEPKNAHEVKEQARKFIREAMAKGSDITSTTVRQYPVTATIGGLLVGFLLGAALFRSRPRE